MLKVIKIPCRRGISIRARSVASIRSILANGLDSAFLDENPERFPLRQTMPGVGPITAIAIETIAPPMTIFRRSWDLAAWLGLVPRQHSTGGKQRLGATSKMGQRDIRRLLIIGAMAVVQHASRKGAPDGSWLGRMLARKRRMLVAIALANKMARGLWAMMTTNKDFKNPATPPA